MGFLKGRETDSGAKTQVYVGGSKTVLGFAYQAKRRNRVVMVGAGVGVVLAATTGLGVMKYLEAAAAGRVVESYGALTQCLLGEAPSNTSPPSVRFRALQLASLTQGDVRRASEKEGPWPDRCGKFAHGLHESLAESAIGDTKGKALVEASKSLAEAIDGKESYWADLSAPIDRTFEEAQRAGMVLKLRGDVAAPPAAIAALTLDALGKEGAITNGPVALSDVRVRSAIDDVVRIVVDAKGVGRVSCTIALDSARCAPLQGEVAKTPGALRLDATTEAEGDAFFAADEGYFDGSGARIGSGGHAIGGHVGGGVTTTLLEGKTGLELELVEAGRTRRIPVTAPGMTIVNPRQAARLLWGQLVAVGSNGKEMTLVAGPEKAGRVDLVGALPKAATSAREVRIDGCRSGGVTVVRARVDRDEYLSFFRDGKWSTPLKAATVGGALQCLSSAAVTTHIEGGTGEASLDAKLVVQRCTPTECKSQSVALRDFYAGEVGLAAATPLAVAAVDGKITVAWQAGQRGGLRLRVADLANLASTPDTIAFDNFVKDGKVIEGSTILDMKLLRAERFGVLLLATPAGLRALRVTSDGKATPVKL